ncbi:DUF6233 domain-containing protein [Streptomyces asoensis]
MSSSPAKRSSDRFMIRMLAATTDTARRRAVSLSPAVRAPAPPRRAEWHLTRSNRTHERSSLFPPRHAAFLKRVQEGDLERTRKWIAREEQRKQQQRRGAKARPPQPDWLIERGLARESPPDMVHADGCHMAGKRSRGIGRSDALRRLAQGIPACTHCRPDSRLRYPEGQGKLLRRGFPALAFLAALFLAGCFFAAVFFFGFASSWTSAFWAGDGLLVEASRSQHAGDQAPVGPIGNGLSAVDEVAVHVVGPGTERFEIVIQ